MHRRFGEFAPSNEIDYQSHLAYQECGPDSVKKTAAVYVLCVEVDPDIEMRFYPLPIDLRKVQKCTEVSFSYPLKVVFCSSWQKQIKS